MSVTGSISPQDAAMERLHAAIGSHRRLSLKNHLLYSSCKTTAIILAALIPLIGVFEPTANILLPVMKVHVTPIQLAAILGALSAMVHSFETFFQFHGQWIASDATEDALTREKYLYLTEAGPYDGQECQFKLLARRVEAILAKSNRQWFVREGVERPQGAESPGFGAPSSAFSSATSPCGDPPAAAMTVASVDVKTVAIAQ